MGGLRFVVCVADEVIGLWWHMIRQMGDGNYEV
jgi:hypothetical protein